MAQQGTDASNRRPTILRSFCFSCGEEVRAVAEGLSPICSRCEARHDPRREPSFTLREPSGKQLGPWTHQQVIDGLKRGTVLPNTWISESGDAFVRLDKHDQFLNYYIPGDPRWNELHKARSDQAEQNSRIQRRRRSRGLTFGVIAVAAVVAPWLALQTGATVFSEGALQRISDNIDQGLAFLSTNFGIGDYAPEKDLPGEAEIGAVRTLWPQAAGSPEKFLKRAWPALLQGDTSGALEARALLEQSVAANPRDLESLNGLAIAYGIYAAEDKEYDARALNLLERARALDEDHVSTMRAQAALGILGGSYTPAAERAQACISTRKDPGYCYWYLGEALIGLKKISEAREALEEARERLPEAHGVQLALARVAADQGEVIEALMLLTRLLRERDDDPRLHESLARLYYQQQLFDEALLACDRALELEPTLFDARLIRGEILLYVEGDLEGADATLRQLVESEGLFQGSRPGEALAQASQAALATGDFERAKELADQGLSRYPDRPELRLALAQSLEQLDELEAAQGALSAIDSTTLSSSELARYHTIAARVYLSTAQQRLAQSELQSAIEAEPTWFTPRMLAATLFIEIGSPNQAVEVLAGGAPHALDAQRAKSPIYLSWYVDPPTEDLQRRIEKEFSTEAQLTSQIPRLTGILEMHRCWARGEYKCMDGRRKLDAALQLDESDLAARMYSAHATLLAEDWGRAKSHLDRALARANNNAVFHAMYGRALYNLDNPGGGEAAFRRAYQITEENGVVYRYHAMALQSSDQARAQELYAEAAELDPTDALSLSESTRIQLAAANAEEAAGDAQE